MGNILMTGIGGGGVTSEDVTITRAHVLKGEKTVTRDSNDEVVEGEMTVNSILSFEVAPYSGRRVLAKWQNPNPTPGKPFGGVIIKCMVGRYPAWNEPDGNLATAVYAGVGNNTAPGGWSQAFMDMPNLNTTYYFTCFGYARTSFGDIYSPVYDPASIKQAVVAIGGALNVTITGAQNYIIPDGYTLADIFCVGGGGGGGCGRANSKLRLAEGGGGGGGGYTTTAASIAVSSGQILNCVVGAGGAGSDGKPDGNTGGVTSVSRNGIALCTANGGLGGKYGSSGGQGGSNGGSGAYNDYDGVIYAAKTGGSDGNPGQGRTTRAFGEGWNTLYAGGGGGGDADNGVQGAGGNGGGGSGGNGYSRGNDAAANTGSGGGGGGATAWNGGAGGNGSSGIILIRLR